MDVQAASVGERMLRRFIAQLVTSAVLAERAAERSLLVRCFVLWLLRRAETVALGFIVDETGMPMAAEGFARAGNGPDAALRLAARFRALAAALAALLPLAGVFGGARAPRGFSFRHVAPASGRRPGTLARVPIDSS